MPLEHALLGLDVNSAHVQTLSLLLLVCHLAAAPPPEEIVKPTNPKSSTAIKSKDNVKEKGKGKLRDKVNKVRNVLKIQDAAAVKKQAPLHVAACEKLLQSGHIRKICWCLLNKSHDVRMLAVEVRQCCEAQLFCCTRWCCM